MQFSALTYGAPWVLVAFWAAIVTEGTPVCERTGQYIQGQDDCSTFYQCVHNEPVVKHCPPGLVFSRTASVCVWPNSVWDDCPEPQANPPAPAPFQGTTAPPAPPATPATAVYPASTEPLVPGPMEDGPEPCTSVSSGLRIDSTSCSRFFNCSLRRAAVAPFLGLFSEECPYRQLFDAATLSCRPARDANCGTRPYSKDPCDWVANRCGGPHCRECSSLKVDCTALRDGAQPYPGREDTPYFIECQDGWFVRAELCPQDANGRYMRFSAGASACVSMSK